MSDNTQEPTMEEILASIRRIISEDDPPAETDAAPAAAAEAPLADLAVPEPVSALADDDDDEEPLVLEDEVIELNEPFEEPVELDITPQADDLEVLPPRGYEPAASGPPPAFNEPLVSRPQASSVASSFDALERTVMMPPGGRSLEDVVREMLRPLLKAWLDENLPAIVEAQVAAEVERIARQRR
jgi:cell pole-organizing protein PopZ